MSPRSNYIHSPVKDKICETVYKQISEQSYGANVHFY